MLLHRMWKVSFEPAFPRRLISTIPAALKMTPVTRSNRGQRRRKRPTYTKAQRNAIIDELVHPLADQHWSFILVDGFLHAINEDNPVESFVKFAKFNLPELVKRILKDT